MQGAPPARVISVAPTTRISPCDRACSSDPDVPRDEANQSSRSRRPRTGRCASRSCRSDLKFSCETATAQFPRSSSTTRHPRKHNNSTMRHANRVTQQDGSESRVGLPRGYQAAEKIKESRQDFRLGSFGYGSDGL